MRRCRNGVQNPPFPRLVRCLTVDSLNFEFAGDLRDGW